ncbi:MAG: hypothetical protein IPL84_00700 [Chitinophagaceae bacterium]|nr:hypothetical protein [Chitinophagaceae bacterium]
MQNRNTTELHWDKVLPDIIVLILYLSLLDPLMAWQLKHLALSCTILMLLNIVAVGLGCFTFFSAYAADDALIKYRNTLSSFESAVIGLSAFITCLAFFWWLVPFTAVKKMGVTETGFSIGATIYFLTFMSIVAGSVNTERVKTPSLSVFMKFCNTAVLIAFFFFSYAFLSVALAHWQPGFMAAPYLAVLCLFVFYLPLRFFLLFRPPFSKLEYISFMLCFGFLIMKLFTRF